MIIILNDILDHIVEVSVQLDHVKLDLLEIIWVVLGFFFPLVKELFQLQRRVILQVYYLLAFVLNVHPLLSYIIFETIEMDPLVVQVKCCFVDEIRLLYDISHYLNVTDLF